MMIVPATLRLLPLKKEDGTLLEEAAPPTHTLPDPAWGPLPASFAAPVAPPPKSESTCWAEKDGLFLFLDTAAPDISALGILEPPVFPGDVLTGEVVYTCSAEEGATIAKVEVVQQSRVTLRRNWKPRLSLADRAKRYALKRGAEIAGDVVSAVAETALDAVNLGMLSNFVETAVGAAGDAAVDNSRYGQTGPRSAAGKLVPMKYRSGEPETVLSAVTVVHSAPVAIAGGASLKFPFSITLHEDTPPTWSGPVSPEGGPIEGFLNNHLVNTVAARLTLADGSVIFADFRDGKMGRGQPKHRTLHVGSRAVPPAPYLAAQKTSGTGIPFLATAAACCGGGGEEKMGTLDFALTLPTSVIYMAPADKAGAPLPLPRAPGAPAMWAELGVSIATHGEELEFAPRLLLQHSLITVFDAERLERKAICELRPMFPVAMLTSAHGLDRPMALQSVQSTQIMYSVKNMGVCFAHRCPSFDISWQGEGKTRRMISEWQLLIDFKGADGAHGLVVWMSNNPSTPAAVVSAAAALRAAIAAGAAPALKLAAVLPAAGIDAAATADAAAVPAGASMDPATAPAQAAEATTPQVAATEAAVPAADPSV